MKDRWSEGRKDEPMERPDDEVGGARAEAVQRYTDELLERAAGNERDDAALERGLATWRAARDGADRTGIAVGPNSRTNSERMQRVRALLASAAGLLVTAAAILFFTLGPGTPTAEAALASALERAREMVPRAYHVLFERGGAIGATREVDLYVSGERVFALSKQVPGGTLWVGGDAEDLWIVPAKSFRPVVVTERRPRADSLLVENDVDLPYIDVVSALEACSEHYVATLSDNGRVLDGTRRADAPKDKPDGFRLELDADGLITRLELWRTGVLELGDWRFELEATGEPVDPSVFAHATHHHPQRRVVER